MKIINVVGARPNFMKVAPLHREFSKRPQIESLVLHTGQHYDARMSDVFFRQLELPTPDYYLGVGGGTHTMQTAGIMLKFEEVVNKEKPDVVLVVGDVNSTIACALVAVKNHIPLVHVEAGLRSGDRQMPEEINRILTDRISDHLFVTEQSGLVHLAAEGVPDASVHFVGNVMIDSLVGFRRKAAEATVLKDLGLAPQSYVLMTMHRPANVDNQAGLEKILQMIERIVQDCPVVFPLHPRTGNKLKEFGLYDKLSSLPGVHLLEPQGYLEFLHLMERAKMILTDSGGIQEETTFLQVPCLTFRDSTERPITTLLGTNTLLDSLDPDEAIKHFQAVLSGQYKQGVIPPFWDGQASVRIADILETLYQN
ncbi:MAG: UDP-N-acetylglucosamine 2-epimerase (non-hydrolyzing) [Saprospiraceae bacterium]|nr:UDP-N-acetylglucosamine 2-epimerase (non-hydrolyzing) [Saprospiraceae bacterium]